MPFIKSSDETIKRQHNIFIAKEFGDIDKVEKSRPPSYIVLDHSDLKTSSHLNSAGIENKRIIVPNPSRDVVNEISFNSINEIVDTKPGIFVGTLCQLVQDPTFLQGKTIGGIWYDSTSRYSTSETQETIKQIFTKLQFLENAVLAFTFTGQRGTKVEWEDVIHNVQDNLKATAREIGNLNLKCIKREVYGNQMIFIAFSIIKKNIKTPKKRQYDEQSFTLNLPNEWIQSYRNKRTRNNMVDIASETESNSSSSNNESESGYEVEDQSDTEMASNSEIASVHENENESENKSLQPKRRQKVNQNAFRSDERDRAGEHEDYEPESDDYSEDDEFEVQQHIMKRPKTRSTLKRIQQLSITGNICGHCNAPEIPTIASECKHCQKSGYIHEMIQCSHQDTVWCPQSGRFEKIECNSFMHKSCVDGDEFVCGLHWCYSCKSCKSDKDMLDANPRVFSCIFCVMNGACDVCEQSAWDFQEITSENFEQVIPFADKALRLKDAANQRYFVCESCTDRPSHLTKSEIKSWEKLNPRKSYREFKPSTKKFEPAKFML